MTFLLYCLLMTVLVLGLCLATWRRWSVGVWVFKPLAALTFVAAALSMGALGSCYGQAMLVGFAFCVLGDVLLIPKSNKAFLAGLAAFLLGHVGFSVAFVLRGLDLKGTLIATAALVLVALAVGRWLLPRVGRSMKGPVLAYMTVITAMVALSVGTTSHAGNTLVFVGAFAFYLSDLCVARERFVAPGMLNRAIGLPLYFGAQMVLASTLS